MTAHALTRTVDTPTGQYVAGLAVRVVRRRGADVTIDVSPPGVAPRYYTVPASTVQIVRGPQPAGCGTSSGVRRHEQRGEPACPACADHRNDRRRADRIRACRAKSVVVPVDVLAATLEGADTRTLAMLSDRLGRATVDALIDAAAPMPSGSSPNAS